MLALALETAVERSDNTAFKAKLGTVLFWSPDIPHDSNVSVRAVKTFVNTMVEFDDMFMS